MIRFQIWKMNTSKNCIKVFTTNKNALIAIVSYVEKELGGLTTMLLTAASRGTDT